jgi:hypothetical protein
MNGKIRFRVGRRAGTILGGPFVKAKERWGFKKVFRVCLREGQPPAAECHFPIVDFGVPKKEDLQILVDKIVTKLLRDKPVYVGCTAGIGRTGMIIACVWKTFHRCTGPQAVAGVRKNYLAAAVETPAQHKLIDDFEPLFRTKVKLFFARLGL